MQSRRFFHRELCIVALAACCGAFAGCRDSLESEVSGQVTLDGAKVGPGTIVFAPVGAAHNPATGTIQVDGTYFMNSNRTRGLPAGRYQVAVTVFDQPAVPMGQRSTVAAPLITPEKYADPATSGLEFDVAPGSNKINVELTSQ
ncbi:MAG TPA: hypothetical protein PKC18_15940 [Lacipirellulaceae bacterium]|nr:hypothetical protein [Lacipirellulaceae bacterium]HMP07011.1 hypothetical protein [Lacipirellulaceae bacterium]